MPKTTAQTPEELHRELEKRLDENTFGSLPLEDLLPLLYVIWLHIRRLERKAEGRE